MNDRVVDRAAAHATPAELAVRDWLLVGLSLATGIYEAICFLTFGDLMLRHAHRSAPVVPAVLTALIIAIAWVALKPRATSGPVGEQGLPVQQAVK